MLALVKKSDYLTMEVGEIYRAKKQNRDYALLSPIGDWLFFLKEEIEILGVKQYYKIC